MRKLQSLLPDLRHVLPGHGRPGHFTDGNREQLISEVVQRESW